ncbi:hypothetical protein AKJ37_07395 [candidate division MSBL1 archaeon SCGC-AAA259I09]|uniref:Uncharacterized protein n=1 Tax=candidate division MSBL1 archaeon SCGC-AAA259I09 TaxID=1698267 RepID=A0A133UKE9_9EURY|nr:hypothetical protein AKJ37_07395 [candidate division MSBL1 archaeon SCGC-AAA259I09]
MERVQELESELRKYDNPNTPSSKKRKRKTKRNRKREESKEETGENPEDESEDGEERFPGKPKGAGGGGISIPVTDDVQHYTLEGDGLEEIGTWEKTVIELPEKLFRVVKHVIHVYEDREGRKVEPEVDLPEGIYGKR